MSEIEHVYGQIIGANDRLDNDDDCLLVYHGFANVFDGDINVVINCTPVDSINTFISTVYHHLTVFKFV